MPLTKARCRIWLGFSALYVAFTVWAYYHALTCHEMFCGAILFYPALPWSICVFGSLELFNAWLVLTPLCVLLNIAILYFLLRKRRTPKEVY